MRRRKCFITPCRELATNKVVVAFGSEDQLHTRVGHLCEGHAYILMGCYDKVLFQQCPCCHVYVGRGVDEITKRIKDQT